MILTRTDCASSDHSVAATALLEGLISHPRDQPGYFIHTSGTGVLTFADTERGVYGEASSKLFNDWDGIGEITALPDFALHREIDKIVLRAGIENASRAKTAIVCPPAIYGIGRGPSNKTSVQIPRLARSILIKKQGIQIGPGKNYWGNVHVHDLSDVYCKLVEAAASGGGKATWGAEGYYFTENGEHVWGHVSKLVASAAHSQGLIPSTEVVTIPDDEANQLVEYAVILWGTNSRAKAIRARNLLQWAPASETLEDTIAEAVAIEAKKLGLIQGHAAKASS